MFLLHVQFASGFVRTLTFPDAFSRGLVMITLAAQPVLLIMEDK
jgi:hypothetical protein